MRTQKTLKKSVFLKGVGLHSGQWVQLEVHPAPIHSGIQFVRGDLPGAHPEQALFQQISNTQLATTLKLKSGPSQSISTVEHLMAAVVGCGLSNLKIVVHGAEIPILDGSAWPFAQAFIEAGIESQSAALRTLVLKRRVELRIGAKWAAAEPCDRFEVHGTVEWDHPAIGFQRFQYLDGETPIEEWAKARTFGFLKDVEALQKMGLIRGGSLENAVVLDRVGILNPEGLRFDNEFARHKVLDALGDFALAGAYLQVRFRLHRAGHDIHNQILREIFRRPDQYEWSESADSDVEPKPARRAGAFAEGVRRPEKTLVDTGTLFA